ncbi:TPA: fimbrial protein [Citrobacter amalonaticus]
MFIFKMENCFCFLQKKIIKLAAVFFVLLQMIFMPQAWASITGAHGVEYGEGVIACVDSTVIKIIGESQIIANHCHLTAITEDNYVPASGNYKVRLYVYPNDKSELLYADSMPAYLNASKSVRDQNIDVSGGSSVDIPGKYIQQLMSSCYALVSEQGKAFALKLANSSPGSCGDVDPLPPTPQPDISCVLNNGSALDVDLGTLDRAQLPTAPTDGKVVPISVNCTGGSVTVNMQLKYDPITIGANELVQSDVNGLGVAIMYNNKTLSTTDITPLDFVEGGNTFDLAFQAVRDPNVAEGEVPVGIFNASATLSMTQQ